MVGEVHVERVIGKKVRDADGDVVGRLGELVVEDLGGEVVLTEIHIGPSAMLERVGVFVTQLPYFTLIPFPRWRYRVGWQDVDWSDPDHPRLRVRKADLERTNIERSS
ncbi:MAG TPA: PRC-barrel domain-containing protein [Gemmatimonadaceae bacterium]|jgi:sporulation protein YlmC with PRC-barrel domain|nr:PRC-barrel domain-containing protein [Gemmatimonadaceae bacterium]